MAEFRFKNSKISSRRGVTRNVNIKIEKIKYSRKLAKRFMTPFFWRIRKNGNIAGEAQTLQLAKNLLEI